MELLGRLLALEESPLAPATRAAVIGFRAQLAHLLERHAQDAGAQSVRALLAELDRTLGGSTNSPDVRPLVQGAVVVPPSAPSDTPWELLAAQWGATPDGKALLPQIATLATPQGLYLLTWRLAPSLARSWQAEWKQTTGNASNAESLEVPGPFEETLYPSVEKGQTGVFLSTQAPLSLPFEARTPLARRLGRVIAACLWFAENDPWLKLCLQCLYRFGFTALQEAHRSRYAKSAFDRLERLAQAEEAGDAAELVRAWVEVDEAVHSLVHQPLAHPQSLYAKLTRTSRDSLPEVCEQAHRAGLPLHTQVIAGLYADTLQLTDRADIEGQGTGAPGEVVHCCRVFYRLAGTAHPGRVIYKPR